MPRRLPPLNALRAFEAAARHSSFSLAAEELRLTAAAVSQHVKALEAHLGVRLFHRHPNGLSLSEAGRACLPALSDGFDQLAQATALVRGLDLAGRLVVSALPAFAAGWLAPRLTALRGRFPEVDLLIRSEARRVDFQREDVDVAIRFGPGPFPRLVAHHLMDEEVFPVCAPALLAATPPVRSLDDLRHLPLLHDPDAEPDQPWMSWPAWLSGTRVPPELARRGPRFTDSLTMIGAALAGQGAALGRGPLLGDHLEKGRLVRLLQISRKAGWSYHVVAPRDRHERPVVRAFVAWLRGEAGGTERVGP